MKLQALLFAIASRRIIIAYSPAGALDASFEHGSPSHSSLNLPVLTRDISTKNSLKAPEIATSSTAKS